MSPEKLLQAISSKWPEKIDFETSVNEHDEFQPIWAIVRAYEKVDETINSKKEPWLDLANWCFNQAITAVARSNYLSGNSSVTSREVSVREFDKRILKNLQEEGWKNLRAKYKGWKK